VAESLSGVSKTALGVARIRAGESRRPDRLFEDPYAAAFVAAMPDAYAGVQRSDAQRAVGAALALHVVIRTKFYDDYLLGATAAGCRQVVLLAAGLDTRAFRLDWPAGIRLFEVDLPEVSAFKQRVLDDTAAAPRCERHAVVADLTTDWRTPLAQAGFDAAVPTAWLVEGLLVYLTRDDAAQLLTDVGALSAPASRLSCEQGRTAAQLTAAAARTEATALWQGGLEADTVAWLDEHGWETTTHDLATLAASYGRDVPGEGRSGFVSARYRGRGELSAGG
jgi:methyltransferase (TIGR00027 family)